MLLFDTQSISFYNEQLFIINEQNVLFHPNFNTFFNFQALKKTLKWKVHLETLQFSKIHRM